MILFIVAGIVVWLLLGLVAAGWYYSYCQNEFPFIAKEYERLEFYGALFLIPFGLCSFIPSLTLKLRTGKYLWCHGWSLKRKNRESKTE